MASTNEYLTAQTLATRFHVTAATVLAWARRGWEAIEA